MKRTFAATGLLLVGVFAFGGPDLTACGDKSLAAGGIRIQRARAARFPASILIYRPAASRISDATRALKLQRTLTDYGHKYQEVSSAPELQASLATGQYNIVLADFGDVPELQQQLESVRARAVLIPVAYKLTKAETKEAAKQCRFLIKAPGSALEYLATIHDAVQFGSAIPRKS